MRPASSRRFAVLLIAVAAIAASCSGASPETTASPTTTAAPSTSSSTTTTGGSDTSTTSTTSTVIENAALRAQIDELIEITEDLRELDFLRPPTITVVTEEELAQRVRDQIGTDLDPDDLARDTALWVLLGLIEPGTDLLALYSDLLSEQVGGYYDGEAEEMVVPAGEDLDPLQEMVLVHELVHALVDQHYGFAQRLEELDDQHRDDEFSALQALAEGDAQFTSILYVTELPAAQQLGLVTLLLDQDTEVYDRTPRVIQDLLRFPYEQGQVFVESLWGTSTGFDRVNAAYAEPPTTTEQIYHPSAFARGEVGSPVEVPPLPLTGYQAEEDSVWGEISFRVMFQHALDLDTATVAADGWGGDLSRMLWNGEEVALVLVYEGDTPGDTNEISEALVAYVQTVMDTGPPTETADGVSFSGEDFAYVGDLGDRAVFVAASDPAAGAQLVDALAGS